MLALRLCKKCSAPKNTRKQIGGHSEADYHSGLLARLPPHARASSLASGYLDTDEVWPACPLRMATDNDTTVARGPKSLAQAVNAVRPPMRTGALVPTQAVRGVEELGLWSLQ